MNLICSCLFTDGGWDKKDWLQVKSPRWEHNGDWIQGEDHICNRVPGGVDEIELMGSEAGRTYSSMLYKELVTDFVVGVEMSFDYRMAPLIVLSGAPAQHSDGSFVYRDHIEVVLFDEGVNVWSHSWDETNGPTWRKLSFFQLPTLPKERYFLEVTRSGEQVLNIRCNEQSFEVAADLPERLHVGITGCEGLNRFYEFSLSAL
tara:strand:- start:725 stop:1333 length:609 start_codon:yes stop_codon:yes gene_type:complete